MSAAMKLLEGYRFWLFLTYTGPMVHMLARGRRLAENKNTVGATEVERQVSQIVPLVPS